MGQVPLRQPPPALLLGHSPSSPSVSNRGLDGVPTTHWARDRCLEPAHSPASKIPQVRTQVRRQTQHMLQPTLWKERGAAGLRKTPIARRLQAACRRLESLSKDGQDFAGEGKRIVPDQESERDWRSGKAQHARGPGAGRSGWMEMAGGQCAQSLGRGLGHAGLSASLYKHRVALSLEPSESHTDQKPECSLHTSAPWCGNGWVQRDKARGVAPSSPGPQLLPPHEASRVQKRDGGEAAGPEAGEGLNTSRRPGDLGPLAMRSHTCAISSLCLAGPLQAVCSALCVQWTDNRWGRCGKLA